MNKLVFAVLTVMMMNSCASMQELSNDVMQQKKSGKAGVTRVYPIPADQAWDISRAVFRWEKVDGVDEHRKENYMITSTGNENDGIWLSNGSLDRTGGFCQYKGHGSDEAQG